VRETAVTVSWTAAMPKSRSLGVSSGVLGLARRMFSGLTSRWTMPLAWAAARPWAMPRAMARARGTGKRTSGVKTPLSFWGPCGTTEVVP